MRSKPLSPISLAILRLTASIISFYVDGDRLLQQLVCARLREKELASFPIFLIAFVVCGSERT